MAVALVVALLVSVAASTGFFWRPSTASTDAGDLTVALTASPSIGYAPISVTFTAAVTGGVGPYTYAWTDGGTAVTGGAQWFGTFDAPGNRSIKVNVTDGQGDSATSELLFSAVSTQPQARGYIPGATSVQNAELTIRWHAATVIDTCILGSYGTIDVPSFSDCANAGGLTGSGTGNAVVFTPNPDDPEVTPVLFQTQSSGVAIGVAWWFNYTDGTQSTGSLALTTAVTPL